MHSLSFSNKAAEDLSAIWEYTYDTWSEEQADKYYQFLIEACEQIAGNPAIGKSYKVVSVDLFGLQAGRHIIFIKFPGRKEFLY